MYRTTSRVRVKPDGMVEIVDPCMEDLELLKAIDSDYRILSTSLHGFTSPRFQALRNWQTEFPKERTYEAPSDVLAKIHSKEMDGIKKRNYDGSLNKKSKGLATLLDVKIELARRELLECRLCGRNCGVNRLAGQFGFCGLGVDAYLGDSFIHIAEEPPINPSLLIELYGCAMRCRFCQKSELHSVCRKKVLGRDVWNRLPLNGARSLSFIGGNPDESLYSILRFLNTTPDDFGLPIVWNCHGYGNIVAYKILKGVVDVYIPDLKYGNDKCAAKWSGVKGYIETAQRCIGEMVHQGAPVFVRMLILPGHSECCHIPSIRWLKEYRDSVLVNIMDQYYPEINITKLDGPMANRPGVEEVQRVINEAEKAGLNLI